MHETFLKHAESLHASFERLVSMPPVRFGAFPADVPKRGVYLFSEGCDHLYVGRTDRLRPRLVEHGRETADHNTAPFAFLLARQELDRINPGLRGKMTRRQLEGDAHFAQLFTDMKRRVRRMDFRYVEERDPVCQALLEIYIAVVLRTPYNNFENH